VTPVVFLKEGPLRDADVPFEDAGAHSLKDVAVFSQECKSILSGIRTERRHVRGMPVWEETVSWIGILVTTCV
jgi:hypothetical protein